MIFNSMDFMVFFCTMLLGYWIVPKKGRCIYLLIASYIFYMGWNPQYALLILFSTMATWLSSLLISRNRKKKKLVALICIILNLGILVYFKYSGFLLENINLFMDWLGLGQMRRKVDILLPVGISFYTFQALGYTIDVYRGEIEAERSFIKYALFVSFFPQLVAGPIERSKQLLGQIQTIEEKKIWNTEEIIRGFYLILWGLFQKMVIADRLAILVDTVFDSYWQYEFFGLSVAAAGFAIQIYCDFASYSLIAMGSAGIMGFHLMENFNVPYMALSVSDFWRRWHISLSTWLRDYVYIPLGGNRCKSLKKYRNLLVTFLVSGIWHGANWTFLAWGGIHAVYQIVGSATYGWREKIYDQLCVKRDCFSYRLGRRVVTFILVDLAWILFRSDTIGDAFYYIKRMITKRDYWSFFNGSIYTLGLKREEISVLGFSLGILALVDIIKYIKGERLDSFFAETEFMVSMGDSLFSDCFHYHLWYLWRGI